MFISKSNILDITNTTVVTDGSGNIPTEYLLNKDFSEVYRSGTASNIFRVELDVVGINYIAIAGLDVFGICTKIDFEYWNGSSYVIAETQNVTSNATLMFVNTTGIVADKWRVAFTKVFSNLRVGLAYIAAGNYWEVPNGGEQSGYQRPWSTPSYKQRTQNNQGMPTSSVIESMGVSSTLNIANVRTSEVISNWEPLQGYAVRNGVFINENPNYLDQSYYCYNCIPSAVKAHSQTRELQNLSMKFTAWTGRTI